MIALAGETEFSVMVAFYADLQIVVDLCPKSDILIVLGDFSATTGNSEDESCVGSHGSDTKYESSSMRLDFAKCRRFSMIGS